MFYSGSDITELLKRAERPVLVYKPMARSGIVLEKPFEKPLLAVDGSPASLRAVQYIEKLKNVVNEVHLLYVASPKELKGTSNLNIQQLRKEKRKELEKVSEGLEDKGIRTRSHVYIGDTVEEIERAARECQSTIIVMGSSGRASWIERWIGSTPRTIAERSPFPTLIIPYQGD
jgi:nucleotide-binding universal stress UspA family protein